ncbi:MAG: hypothetical protein AAGI49_07255 [Bacteroidota bacterium]
MFGYRPKKIFEKRFYLQEATDAQKSYESSQQLAIGHGIAMGKAV